MLVLICFICTSLGPIPQAYADFVIPARAGIQGLPAFGTMVNLSPAYEPVLVKGLKVNQENPFHFDFIVDSGDVLCHFERSEESQQEGQGVQMKLDVAMISRLSGKKSA